MTDIMVDVPSVCPHPGCTKSFGHELDPEDEEHGRGMYAPTTVQGLINVLQTIGNKDLPVVVYDGMDTNTVHQLVVENLHYWDDGVPMEGLVLQIQGR